MKTSKTAIGGFVVGALALGIASIVAFGGGAFFERAQTVVMYFDASTKGLNVGAPVALKGVKIGAVTAIDLQMNVDTLEYRTAVEADLQRGISTPFGDEQKIEELEGAVGDARQRITDEYLRQLVEKGLRAKLEQQSFVTGMLLIEVDVYEDVESAQLVRSEDGHWVIPTIPSDMDRLTRTLQNLPVDEILQDVRTAIRGIEESVNSDELKAILANAKEISGDVAGLTATLDGRVSGIEDDARALMKEAREIAERVGPLADELEGALADARGLIGRIDGRVGPLADDLSTTLGEARELARTVDREVQKSSADAREALRSAAAALESANASLALLSGPVPADATVLYQLTTTLERLAAASESVSSLAQYLQLHPEALIQGKDD